MDLVQKIQEMLEPLMEGTDVFLVSLKVKPTNNIKVFLDADDGFPISKSSQINRKLRAKIDESGLFPEGDYSLEVSSPGIDEPLVLFRQYPKNVGRNIEITQQDGTVVLGKLLSVNEEQIELEVAGEGKKKTSTLVSIDFANIKQAVIQISF